METTHSKTSRAKKPASKIVVNQWDDVWQSFRETNEMTTIEAMNAEGWKTIKQASADSGYAENYINALANRGQKLELTKKRVNCGASVREINFVRPKI
jgi:hypothetical protein